MGKTASLKRGHRARKRGVPFRTLEGDQVVYDFRILDGNGHDRILAYATTYAKERGADAKEGNVVFEYGKNIMTAALGTLVHIPAPSPEYEDRMAPDEPVELEFSGPDDVLESCDRDRIRILADHQRRLQAVTSPVQGAKSNEEYWRDVIALAASEERDSGFFAHWAPDMLFRFARSMAVMLLEMGFSASQTGKSSLSSNIERWLSDPSFRAAVEASQSQEPPSSPPTSSSPERE